MVTYLTGPVLSLILIVLAGIALRYALWYRAAEGSKDSEELIGLRSETASLSQEVSKLCEQKENLKHALTDHENSHTRVRDEYDQLRREYDVLKDASRQLELAAQNNHEESRLRLRDEYDQLRSAYDVLKDTSRQLELESQTKHEETCLRLRNEYDQLQNEYDVLKDTSRQLELESQAKHEETCLRLRNEYDQLQNEYDALKDTSRQLELESQIKHEEICLRLRGEYDQLRSEYDSLKDTSRQLELESQAKHEEICLRLRGEYDQLRSEYDSLHEASHQLELQSDIQRKSVEHAEETLQSLRDDLAVESQRSDARQTELDAANTTISQLRDEVDLAGDLRLQLDASRENCRELQQALEQSLESIAHLEVDARLASVLREEQTSLQHALKDKTECVHDLAAERDEFATRLEAALGDATQLRDEIAVHKDRIEQLEEQHEDAFRQMDQERLQRQSAEEGRQQAEEAIAKLKEDVAAWREAHHRLQATSAETQSQISTLNDERESLTSSLSAAAERVGELNAYIAELKEDISRNEGLARKLRIEKEEVLTRFERERNELGTTILTLRSESDDLRAANDGMAAELEQAKESCRAVEQELDVERTQSTSLVAFLRAETDELRDAQELAGAALEREQSMHRSLEQELRGENAKLCEERTAVAADFERERFEREAIENSLRGDIAQLKESIDTVQLAKQAVEDELQRKMDHFMSIESVLRCETEELRQEKESTIAELMNEQCSRQQLEEALRLHAETLDKLRADSMSLEELSARQSAIHASLNQHANQLRVFTGEAHEGISVRTETEQASVDSSAVVLTFYEAAPNQATSTDRAAVRDDAAPGFVYDAPPAYQDDLKLISGIGEILEKRLNDLGVYTYEQIMNWDQVAIYEFSTRLAFQDRIESEEWVEQARRLHDERYGRAAA